MRQPRHIEDLCLQDCIKQAGNVKKNRPCVAPTGIKTEMCHTTAFHESTRMRTK